jgi:thymidylate kinase
MSIFIFCGPDGVGKTTAAKEFSKLFEAPYIKFPYGSDGNPDATAHSGRVIREILNNTEHPCNPVAFQALQYLNKIETIPLIEALEKEFGIVFIDRWFPSALIYGEVDGIDRAWNGFLCKSLDDLLQPTLLFVFVGEPFKKDNDIYGNKQERIRELYEKYCASQINNPTVVRIDVTGKTLEEVHAECFYHIVNAMLTKKQPGSIFEVQKCQ